MTPARAFASLLLALFLGLPAAAADRPHFVIVLVDDLCWDEVGGLD